MQIVEASEEIVFLFSKTSENLKYYVNMNI